jgi:hypothetical protein
MNNNGHDNGTQAVSNLELEAERLRMNQILGLDLVSPKMVEPTDDDDAYEDEGDSSPASVTHSQLRFWERGSSHILFIGVASALVIGLLLSLYNSIVGNRRGEFAQEDQKIEAKENNFFGKEEDEGAGDLKTNAALADQRARFANLPIIPRSQPPKAVNVVKPIIPPRAPVPRIVAIPQPVEAPRPQPVISYMPPPPPVQRSTEPPPTLEQAQKQWEDLGKIASWSAEDNRANVPSIGGYTPALMDGYPQPTGQLAASPAPEPTSTLADQRLAPAAHSAEESAILSGVAPKSIAVGTTVPGTLETPIIYQPAGQGGAGAERFVVSLREPLKATDGSTIFSKGTQLIVKVDGVGESGLMQLSVISANTSRGELPLPQGAIEIRGKKGKPLVAKDRNRKGGGNAFLRGLGLFALGGASRGAQLLNQASQSVVTNNSATVITSQNRNPNFAAGMLEGGTQAILPDMQQSLQDGSYSQKAPLWSLSDDTSVEVFVNQTITI